MPSLCACAAMAAGSTPEVAPGFEEAFGYTNAYRLSSRNTLVLPRVNSAAHS